MERLTIAEAVNEIIRELNLSSNDKRQLKKIKHSIREWLYRKKNGYTARTGKDGKEYASPIPALLEEGDKDTDGKDWFESEGTLFITRKGLEKLIDEKRKDGGRKTYNTKRNYSAT